MNKIKMFFRIVTTPSCWIRNYRTNRPWDEEIDRLLDKPCFSNLTKYTVKLNGIEMWISNYPYAAVTDCINKELGMPTRATVFRFYDALQKYRVESLRNENNI